MKPEMFEHINEQLEIDLDRIYVEASHDMTKMTGEQLHRIMFTVHAWVDLRFGQFLRYEILNKYAEERS